MKDVLINICYLERFMEVPRILFIDHNHSSLRVLGDPRKDRHESSCQVYLTQDRKGLMDISIDTLADKDLKKIDEMLYVDVNIIITIDFRGQRA